MHDLTITERQLSNDEMRILTNELGKFPNVGFIERDKGS